MSVLSYIQHIIPPPRYTTLPNIGIDISDTSLKYIQFERKRSNDTNLLLKKWGEIEIPSGVIERGNVHDLEKLTDVMKKVRKECGVEYVRVSLPEERAYLFETTVKRGTPFKEIRGLLEFKLEENVPLSPSAAFFDYDIVEDDDKEGVLRVIVTVYAKETILNYQKVCQSAGFVPMALEVEASAIARSVVKKGMKETYVIVDFGKTRMGVGIVHSGALMYTSTIDLGGNELSAALRLQLGDMPEKELTVIKNTQGLMHSGGDTHVRDALKEGMRTICNEIETRIHYWHTRDIERGRRNIERVILCGGSSNLAGLPEYLSKSFSIPTERAQVWQNAFSLDDYVPPIDKRHSLGYATAIGLALTDFTETI